MAVCFVLPLAACTVKPQVLSDTQNLAFARVSLSEIASRQEPLSGPMTLYDAMARALKYNLDAKVEVMESALKARELDLANADMLPGLVAGSGYSGRTRADASTPSLRDTDVRTGDLAFSWNVLDFGLSYVRAQQAADQALIQDERRRKVVNSIMEDVRTAYWRTASYERLVKRMRALEGRVQKALAQTRRQSSNGENAPLVSLTYERELIQVQRQIQKIEGELVVARTQLAALANITPGARYELATPPQRPLGLALSAKLPELYEIAASHRPEMREIAYQLRVNDREVTAAMLQLMPSFNLYAGPNFDSNVYIQSNDWVSYGSKISWNLMKLLAMPQVRSKVDAQRTVLQERSLSVAMAVMMQINVSLTRQVHLQAAYETARQLAAVQHRILGQVKAETAAERTSEQVVIREEMNTLLADAEQDMIYADLQNAYANVYASLGIDPFPAQMSLQGSSEVIAARLASLWFERGDGNGASAAGAARAPAVATTSVPVADAGGAVARPAPRLAPAPARIAAAADPAPTAVDAAEITGSVETAIAVPLNLEWPSGKPAPSLPGSAATATLAPVTSVPSPGMLPPTRPAGGSKIASAEARP